MEGVGNLIDLTEWDEPSKETSPEMPGDLVAASNFEGPYDPFDLMEKEACIKGMTLKTLAKEKVASAEGGICPDLNNESPPICMQSDGETPQRRRSNSSFQKQLLKLNASRSMTNTPPQNRSKSDIEKTILHENWQMLAAESPLKLIEDDDVMSTSIDFEEDLRMLRIPILDEPKSDDKVEDKVKEGPGLHRDDQFNEKDFNKILQQVKTMAHERVEKTKWHLIDSAIESIAAVVFGPDVRNADQVPQSPYSYTRQGTFDLELQGTKTRRSFDTTQVQEEESGCTSVEPGSKVDNFPDAMVCSAATFDGESRLDPFDKDLLPSLPSIPSIPVARKEPFMTELVDETLALQINELLERHKLSKTAVGDQEQQGVDPRTVILLVNPSSYGSQVAYASSCIGKPDPMPLSDSNSAGSMRRRSSSLSIQDKSKLPREVLKSDRQVENLPPPREAKSTATVGPMSAAAAFRQRSNSFSTPSNPSTKAYENRRTLMSSRMKTPSITETVGRSNGTAKVAKPIKPVIPIMKVTATNESTYLNPVHPRVPETPMSTRTKPVQKMSCTSTPLPQMRTQQRKSLKPLGSASSGSSLSNVSYSTPNFRRPSISKKTGSG
ncbi:uncharacterized protein LOC108102169 [Drosophila ficusphila]|uniref:uncharacterized protein LOC108102169 n=1 Tax=Drosophila ficusphila TaxID=30025 RepID=UPI0007E833C2|nr:uncharacterized protein LOC108102169 [Drosophila ficusphila]